MSALILRHEQRSPEWYEARRGRLTASVVADAMATRKDGKEAVGPRNLRIRLALERVTGKTLDAGGFISKAMQDGIEREPEARAVYEALTGRMVETVGFVQGQPHGPVPWMVGVSPDAVVLDGDRIVRGAEFKCPEHAAHLDYVTTGIIPDHYQQQVLFSLWVTSAESWDWMSYHPDFPEKLQHKLVTFNRADVQPQIDALVPKWMAFLQSVDEQVAILERLAA